MTKELGTATIDLVMGWPLFDFNEHPFWQIMAGVAGSEVLLLLFGRVVNKQRRKRRDDEYGALFDEAGI